jgi:hypothetical protein
MEQQVEICHTKFKQVSKWTQFIQNTIFSSSPKNDRTKTDT